MAQGLGSLPHQWANWSEIPAPSFHLVQSSYGEKMRSEPEDEKPLSFQIKPTNKKSERSGMHGARVTAVVPDDSVPTCAAVCAASHQHGHGGQSPLHLSCPLGVTLTP